MKTLRDFYIEELKDLYSAEKQLVRALPKLARHATNTDLEEAFTNHLSETENHVTRLEEIFDSLEASPRGKKCIGMEGLIQEANELFESDTEDGVMDAGLISKAQHAEHYEIAGYGTVRTWAQVLGEDHHAELLQQTLDEEENADRLLTEIAESSVNAEAERESEDMADFGDMARPRSRPRARSMKRGRRPTRKRAAAR